MQTSMICNMSFRSVHAARTAGPIWSAIVLGLFVLTGTATAASVQLVETVPDNPNDGSWVFTNNSGTSASFTTVSGGSPVTFDYTPGSISGSLGSQLSGDLAAHLFLTATTMTPASSTTFFGPLFYDQPIDSGTIQILLDTPINGQTNLLTVNFTNATINGFSGTSSFSDQDGLDTGTVTYSSAFLNFAGTSTGNNFMTPLSADLSQGPGNFLNDFTSNGISTFGFDNANLTATAVPEPSSIVLLCLGGITLTGVALRRMRMQSAQF
ncbi:MAG TPA: PEP-CTERM sorting domain-containing protein [Pirellulales bacterium]|jgi:hypothetical protein|nr:PEP-CTERM sorting domain-containing protein [Pirellulales bacterium]